MESGHVTYRERSRRNKVRKHKLEKYDAIVQMIFFSASILWMEMVYHIFTYYSVGEEIMYVILFSVGIGACCSFLTGCFSKKGNRILAVGLIVAFAIFYSVQQVYRSLFKVPLVWNLAVGGAGDVTQYWKEAIRQTMKNFPVVVLLFVPVGVLIAMLRKSQFFRHHNHALAGLHFVVALSLLFLPVGLIRTQGKDSLMYEAYYELSDHSQAAKEMGILMTFLRDASGTGRGEGDLQELVAKKPERTQEAKPASLNTKKKKKVDTSPNKIEIDFDAISKKTSNEKVKILNEYFKTVTPTNKNGYTGMFRGKNLILITAESYSPWAVDKELTPTLYKLSHEGFLFQNFYTALWQTSTSDGEYVALTGLIPDGSQSMKRSKKNAFPFVLAKQFNRLGVESKAFHSNSLSYYDRYLTHPNLGYQFYAAKLGKLSGRYSKNLFAMKESEAWPNSDYECMKATVDRYIEEPTFHAYYMTLSGHCQYTFSGNSMAAKNQQLVKDLPYTEAGKAYIAQNIELDRALAYLLEQLEKKGRLEDTVIALSADHYPYEMGESDIDSLAGTSVDEIFDLYRNQFILWNSGMEKPVKVEKPCSSLDILPTLLNLFGFPYDSRLLAGRDILSDAEGLVIFSNKNFITDKIKYRNATKEVSYLVDQEQIPENYVKEKIGEVKALFTMSAGILDNDYYKYIEPYLQLF